MSTFLEREAGRLWDRNLLLEKENLELRLKIDALDETIQDLRSQNRPKLSESDVEEIRRFHRTARLTNQELADMYSVHRTTISRIIAGVYHQ